MAKVRVNRSDLGPMCTLGMLAGIGFIIYGICNLFGNSMLYGNEAVMAIVSGAIIFVLSLICRIANAPYINQKKQMNAQLAAASARQTPAASANPKLPQDPKFLAVYQRLPHCTDMTALKLEVLKAERMAQYTNYYPTLFKNNPNKEALMIIYERYPATARSLAAEYYDKYLNK